jgi:hypothetical protein
MKSNVQLFKVLGTLSDKFRKFAITLSLKIDGNCDQIDKIATYLMFSFFTHSWCSASAVAR